MDNNRETAMKYRIILTLIVATAIVLPLSAGVKINGVGIEYASIQTAVFNAVSGDTLIVTTGVYHEAVNIYGKDIALDGGYLPDYSAKAGWNSVIDGPWFMLNGPGSVIDITNATVTLRDLDITDGGFSFATPSGYGGGLDIRDGCVVTAETCYIYGNTCKGHGGGVYVYESELVFEDTAVDGNIAYDGLMASSRGGGVYVGNGAFNARGATSDIENNYATSGGGIYGSRAHVRVSDNADVEGNTAVDRGGGIYVENDSLCEVTGNLSVIGAKKNSVTNGSGGGIYAADSTVRDRKSTRLNSSHYS